MKIFILIIILFSALKVRAQAHLGMKESAIQAIYPTNTWKTDYANSGQKYISTDLGNGTFTYYFDNQTQLSDYCIQFPYSMINLNGQVEAYNKKYVITSDSTWTAYLEEGGKMYIRLKYDKTVKMSFFSYSDN